MPRRRLKLKTRRTVPDYPSIEQRTTEQQAELDAYVSGDSDRRPMWLEYPKEDERYFFGPPILTLEEQHQVRVRDWKLADESEDDDE